jgi:hypothetical protein
MTTYKLVITDAPIWGLGERLEDCIIAVRSDHSLNIISSSFSLKLTQFHNIQKFRAFPSQNSRANAGCFVHAG